MSKLINRNSKIRPFATRVAFAMLFVGLTACAAKAPMKPETVTQGDYGFLKNYINELVEHSMRVNNITGVSVAVVDDQEIIYSNGFGFAKRSDGKKATPETVYCVASVSKIFTGMAIMQLVDQGKVDLDKPIKTYLPDFEIKSRFKNTPDITVRQLLNHHSGLPSDRVKGFFFTDFNGNNAIPIKREESFYALASLMKDDYVATPPNTIFSYSNIGYVLLGDIVSRVSGMSFEDYVKQEIFEPLRMANSTFKLGDVRADTMSFGYLAGKEVGVPVIRDIPAGQMMSSVNDLAQLMKAIFANGRYDQKSILSKASLDEMFRIQNTDIKNDGYFRIGLTFWGLPDDNPLRDVRWHGGDLPPFYAAFLTLPNTKLGIVILSNSGKEGSLDLLDIAQPALELAYEIKTKQKLAKPQPSTPVEKNMDALKKYEGQYAMTMGLIDVKAKSNELEIKLMGNTLSATPQSDGSFSPYYKLLGFIPLHPEDLTKIKIGFNEGAEGARLKIKRSGISAMGTLAAVTPVTPTSAWLSRLGEYEVLNPDQEEGYTPSALEYSEKDNYLYFVLNMAKERYDGAVIRFPLKTLSDNEAVILGEGRAMGESIMILNEGGQELVYYSGFKLKKKSRS